MRTYIHSLGQRSRHTHTHTHTHTHKYTNTHTGIHIDGIHAYTQQQTHRQRTTVGADKNLIRDAGTGIVKKEM